MSTDIDVEHESTESAARDLAMMRVLAEEDPAIAVARLEKAAELAPRRRAAIEAILVSQTFEEDWVFHGDFACLKSAGAERVGKCFGIKTYDEKWVREDFEDGLGKGYRYVYSGKARLNELEIYVQGNYSTRDVFLGKIHGEWRPIEDINEGSIRNAAYHVFIGNAVKALLGLRGMPKAQFERIMRATGRDPSKSSTVQRGKGTRGGSTATGDDHAHQKELGEACIAIVNAGHTVQQDSEGNWGLVPLSETDERPAIEIAKSICIALSSFEGDKGPVKGRLASQLTGKWLGSTLGKARKLREQLPTGENE